HVGPAGQDVGDVLWADERDVAPRRALERRHRGSGVDGLLKITAAQRGPEEPRCVRVTRSDGIDHLDGRAPTRPAESAAVEHRGALLTALQADRRLGREAREAVERLLGRAREAEERLRLALTDEEIAHASKHGFEERARLRGRPER